MYGVKYKVPFKTLSGRDSVVTLEERGYAGSVIELIAGGTPFIINTDQSDMLAPIRSSTATLTVVGSDYLQDLYANDPQGIRVKCEVDGAVKWLGYLLPDTFSQDFSSPEFEYEMECVAALSTLKYRKFDLTDDFVTFRQIIEKAVEYSGYEAVYLTNSVRTETGKFYDLKISSSNFFDELGEASTYYEALEEIAKYLGCCFVPFEDDLYLLDYAAIRKGFNSYTKIEGSNVSNVTLSDAKVVDNYKGTGAKISRIAGKNKATVRCSLYEVKNLLPTFDDEKSTFLTMEQTDSTVSTGGKTTTYREIRRYYNQPKFEMYGYLFDRTGERLLEQFVNEGKLAPGYLGSQFIRSAEFDVNNKPSSLVFTDELLVKRYDSVGGSLNNTRPVLKLTSDKRIITHGELYFCISLDVMVNINLFSKNIASTFIDKAEADTTFHLWLKLRIGDRYFDGTGWSLTDTRFRVPITVKKGEQINEKYLSIDNTNTFETGIGNLEGFIIKAPEEIMMGICELTVYSFDDIGLAHNFGAIKDRYIRYKNIKFEYGIPNEQSIFGDWVDGDSTNDLLYENVIDEDYIEEAEEIDLKICTNPDGKLALSSVIEGDGFLKTLTSDVYGTDLPEHLLLDRVIDTFDKPRFVINPILENTAKPYTKFTEPHLNKQFLVAGGEEDVKMESMQYNLIEA